MIRAQEKIKEFETGDGAHCGLADWYPNKEAALRKAIAAKGPFTTGWYGSKKEIASACISRGPTGIYVIETSVSDDFDTPGNGTRVFKCKEGSTVDQIIERIKKEIYPAWDAAEEDQKENRLYTGFKVLHNVKHHSVYYGHEPQGKATIALGWVETYIRNEDDTGMLETPPGDNYHRWGWQMDRSMPKAIRARLERFALSWREGLTVKGWTIEPWKD